MAYLKLFVVALLAGAINGALVGAHFYNKRKERER
jgi:hypothetical protein